jgi:hypothetical protein
MVKLFNIIKKDTNIKGYWLFKDKLYIDNIQLLKFESIRTKEFLQAKQDLFNKKELSVFYIDGKQAFIENNKGEVKILKNCKSFKVKDIDTQKIKALCQSYGGLTLYINKQGFNIDIWTR